MTNDGKEGGESRRRTVRAGPRAPAAAALGLLVVVAASGCGRRPQVDAFRGPAGGDVADRADAGGPVEATPPADAAPVAKTVVDSTAAEAPQDRAAEAAGRDDGPAPPPSPDAGAEAAVPADPWVAPALVVGATAYVLLDPEPGRRPPGGSEVVRLVEAFARMRVAAVQPLADGPAVTLLGKDATCVGRAPREAQVYLGCGVDEGDEASSARFTRRRALLIDVCPDLATDEWSVVFAVEGEAPGLALSRLERPAIGDEQRRRLREIVAGYVRGRDLERQLEPEWGITDVVRVPGLAPDLVVAGYDLSFLTLLVRDGVVLSHLEPGVVPARSFTAGERTFLTVATARECDQVYAVGQDGLEPANTDCLFLFCGDGMP
jgi:hypothetical protein